MIWYWLILLVLAGGSLALHVLNIVHFDTSRRWPAWGVLGLVLFNGGFMAFDGARALIVGDYITPKSGAHAGQLGPWSHVVTACGLDPRSSLMKSIFVIYGLAYVGTAAAFLLGVDGAWWGIGALAVVGLWYLPFGTIINLIVVGLLLLVRPTA